MTINVGSKQMLQCVQYELCWQHDEFMHLAFGGDGELLRSLC